jgi:pilus assembly protein CpaE
VNQLPNNPIRTLVLDDSPDRSDLVANLLRSEPGFAVTASPLAFGEGLRVARKSEPDVIVLVADSLVGADALLTVEELEAAAPTAAVIVLTAGDASRAREFHLAGARDCLAPPYHREALVTSVRKVYLNESRRHERLAANLSKGQRRHRCQVIAFHGSKGGVGTTMVAVNVAVALRRITGERVALVDASLQAGDVGVALNLTSNGGIDDLLPHLNGLEVDLVNRVLVTHPSGVKALLAPRDLERAEAVAGDEIRRILAFLAGQFDYVVVDTPPALDAAGLAALDHADQIVLLTTPDIAALRHTGRFLQLARRLGYPSEKIALVVNRASSHYAIHLREIEKRLGLKPLASIPNMDRAFLRATNHGEILAESTALGSAGRSLGKLAARLVVGSPTPGRPGLLTRLPRPASLFGAGAEAKVPPSQPSPPPTIKTKTQPT